MAEIKVFDNFSREIKDNSLICIIGEKNRFGFVKIVDEGIQIDCASVGADYLSKKNNYDKRRKYGNIWSIYL